MTEENNKPKATLIKHVVTPSEQKEENKSPAKEQDAKQKAPEKRRVVVVKKKVVVVKPQPKSDSDQSASKSVVESPKSDESTKSHEKQGTQHRLGGVRKTTRPASDKLPGISSREVAAGARYGYFPR